LEKGASDKAFDVDYREDVYDDWQDLTAEYILFFERLIVEKLQQ